MMCEATRLQCWCDASSELLEPVPCSVSSPIGRSPDDGCGPIGSRRFLSMSATLVQEAKVADVGASRCMAAAARHHRSRPDDPVTILTTMTSSVAHAPQSLNVMQVLYTAREGTSCAGSIASCRSMRLSPESRHYLEEHGFEVTGQLIVCKPCSLWSAKATTFSTLRAAKRHYSVAHNGAHCLFDCRTATWPLQATRQHTHLYQHVPNSPGSYDVHRASVRHIHHSFDPARP